MPVNAEFFLESPRLFLICCNKPMLEALFESETSLARYLNINIPEQWTEFGEPAFRWTYEKIKNEDSDIKWWCYLPVIKEQRMLAGSCGFKGSPQNGIVEIGYEVSQNYRRQGFGTEIANTLIDFAFQQDDVLAVQAHTLAVENESCGVLKKCGMIKIMELDDPEDGKVWRWEIKK